jgi:Fe-S-cluster containining protein
MKKSHKKNDSSGADRLRFPEDEARYPWLSMLLEGLAVFDRGTTLGIQRARRKQNRPVACRAGCGNCCRTNTDIPVYPLELAGIYWYVIEKLQGPLREKLKAQLASHEGKPPCPFLIDNSCSIYPLRPGVCRLFVVFGRPCGPGEDAYHTRRQDVLTPLEEFKNQAFFVMLPFYGITKDEDRIQAIKNGLIHTRVRNLQECDWKNLAQKMDDHESKISERRDPPGP